MCGIAGIITIHPQIHNVENFIEFMLESQKSRGPDYRGKVILKNKELTLGLGHNRLSILDLSPKSHQPFWDSSRRYVLTYNGEIYNYRELKKDLEQKGIAFQTTSDTEVLLQGLIHEQEAFIEKLNGMFAFAFWDEYERTLLLVRDRFGVKPCYYYNNQDHFAFASQANSLAEYFKFSPSLDYLAKGLKYNIYEDSRFFAPFEKIKALPPGHRLKIQFKNNFFPDLKKYYCLNNKVKEKQESLKTWSYEKTTSYIEEVFQRAVQIRTRSDVPIALSLSGGLDSSMVALYLSKMNLNLGAYHFGHPDVPHSEGPLVAKLALKLKLDVNYVWPDPEAIFEGFKQTLKHQGAPFVNMSVIAQNLVYQRAHEEGIKVLLGGQGGDEAFMGYRKFQIFKLKSLLKNKSYLSLFFYLGSLSKMLLAEAPDLKKYWSQRKRYLNQQGMSCLLDQKTNEKVNLSLGNGQLYERQIKDVTDLSLPSLLRFEDRNSMGHSIESRLPFMDYELMELGLALPDGFKLNHGYGKWILREISQSKLPHEIVLARYKKGFEVQYKSWIENGIGEYIRAQIRSKKKELSHCLSLKDDFSENYPDYELIYKRQKLQEALSLAWLSQFI